MGNDISETRAALISSHIKNLVEFSKTEIPAGAKYKGSHTLSVNDLHYLNYFLNKDMAV